MYKIQNIKLTNFKFFFGDTDLKLDRKHTLIYGENGSGKSSIFWALHCFLQSTLKPDEESVQKYFVPISQHEESIRNRYAPDENNSGVTITLKHEQSNRFADITAEISNTTVTTRTNTTIRMMALSSELINYKVIYNMYLATNRDSIDLFSYFEKNLMEFIDFDSSLNTYDNKTISNNSLDWWRYIQRGFVPYTTMQDPKYILFQKHVKLFNERLSGYLKQIKDATNEYLHKYFKEDFIIEYRYADCVYNDFKIGVDQKPHGRTRTTSKPRIELIVKLPNLQGKAAIVERPQSYLNEARLSAIAVATRLAILNERYIKDAPRIMVLDDLLLSLDMGNRMSILSILLKRYAIDYQLIILTHDKLFFEAVLEHLSDKEKSTEWKIYEMFETQMDGKKVPLIQPYNSPLSKAYSYFRGNGSFIDYNACGNNQRVAIEGIFKEQIKAYSLRNVKNGNLINTNNLMIANCIAYAKSMYAAIGFDTSILDELDRYRSESLNPTSHHNPTSNFYKHDIERVFEIIELLDNHKITTLIPKDQNLILRVNFTDGTSLNYEVKILDNILIYKKPDGIYYLQSSDKRHYVIKKIDNMDVNYKINSMTLLSLYQDTIAGIPDKNKKAVIEDVETAYSYNGKTIKELLDLYNAV